jgi:hypothetical protein
MWRGFQRHHARNTRPNATAQPRPRKQASQHASSSLFCFCFFFVPVTQWQWGVWAHEVCCMRPKHTTRPRVGVGGVGVCCGPGPTWVCSRNVYYYCVVAAIPPSSKSGLAEGKDYFLFLQTKNVGNTRKRKRRSLGFLVFKHGDASVCPGPDAAWCRLNKESSTRGHGRFHFFRRRGHRGLRGLPLFIFILVVCRPPARPPARPQAASRVHQRGGTTAADNSDLSGARAAQAWVWAGVAHTCISNAKTEQGPVR